MVQVTTSLMSHYLGFFSSMFLLLAAVPLYVLPRLVTATRSSCSEHGNRSTKASFTVTVPLVLSYTTGCNFLLFNFSSTPTGGVKFAPLLNHITVRHCLGLHRFLWGSHHSTDVSSDMIARDRSSNFRQHIEACCI